MKKFKIIAVLVALISTAVLERAAQCTEPCFNPIIEHSEIKAHYSEELRATRIVWKRINGEDYARMMLDWDSVLVEDY